MRRAFTSGSAISADLTLPVMAASLIASPALSIAWPVAEAAESTAAAVVDIALDAVALGATVVVEVVVDVDPEGVSVTVVFFSQAASRAAAATTARAVAWKLWVFMEFSWCAPFEPATRIVGSRNARSTPEMYVVAQTDELSGACPTRRFLPGASGPLEGLAARDSGARRRRELAEPGALAQPGADAVALAAIVRVELIEQRAIARASQPARNSNGPAG